MINNKFYVSVAIDYPNSSPHMGHAYEKIVGDFFARWYRLEGKDLMFSYGLDEHGQKIKDTASDKGLTPKEFVDKQYIVFKNFVEKLLITNNTFVRTTSDKHAKLAKELFKKVLDKGEIYKGEYKGNYCKYEETFYTNTQLVNGKCPECGRETKIVSEEAYFFKMGLYQQKLIDHIENNPNFIVPETRKNEILSRLKNDELRDLCVSRSSFDWGIKLPNDEKHIIYVWFDALINYLTAIDYSLEKGSDFWPADLHVIGKDIIWFHTVIWPSMLMSLEIPLPKTVYAHGFINDAEGKAMSKSLGNGVDPINLIDKYGVDALRYYLLRVVSSGEDGNFDEKELIEKYNKELGNDYGNLVKRIEVLSQKYFNGILKNDNFDDEIRVIDSIGNIKKEVRTLNYNRVLDLILKEVRKINSYLNEKEPWKNEENRMMVLYNVVENLRFVTILLNPFIPYSSEVVSRNFGFDISLLSELKFGEKEYELGNNEVLFPRIEIKKENEIFPLNLRVGKIVDVKKHPEADKLFIEQIDFGGECTQIVSGLAGHFETQELVGKNVLIVSNLKKAKLRGVESYGMLLVAQKDGKMVLLESDLEPGSYITIEGYDNKTTNLKFDDFLNVKLEVKNNKVLYKGNELKGISVDISDGAKIS